MTFHTSQTWYDQLGPDDLLFDDHSEEIDELKNEIKHLRFQMNQETKDREDFIKRHLDTLKKEIYGNEQIDSFKLDSSICNIAWIVGQTNNVNRIINIQRKGS